VREEALDNAQILIVDDERRILSSLNALLRIAGYTDVVTCEDSRHVADLIEAHRFSVALIDLSMPYVSGQELLEMFRATAPDVPVIVVTATDDIDTAVACLKAGAFDYLVKPVKKSRVLPAVDRALELSGLRRENRYLKQILVSGDEDAANRQIEYTGDGGSYHTIMGLRKEFRMLVERIPVPVFVAILESGRVEFCNESYASFFACSSAQEAVETNVNLFDHIQERDAVALRDRLLAGEDVSGIEVTGTGPEAREFQIILSCAYGPDGYLTGSFVDRTDQKELERQFLHAQKMEAVGRFASSIAHDFNNVLTTINGSADLILIAPDNADEVTENVREIKKATKNATALTGQLLAFGRKDTAYRKTTSAHKVIEDTFGLLRRLVNDEVEITIDLAAIDDTVVMDPTSLGQILMNLTINAQDAIDGSGMIRIHTSTEQSGRHLTLTVADNGCGIADEARARMFEPFYTTKPNGTGLGLSTVASIVDQHFGEIEVNSKPGHGTEISLRLPTRASVKDLCQMSLV